MSLLAGPTPDLPVIVIDNGSWMCRAGLSNAKDPVCIFSPQVYRLKARKKHQPAFSIGEETALLQKKLNAFNASSPFDSGIVCNYTNQERVFDYAFNKCQVTSRKIANGDTFDGAIENAVLLTECVGNPMRCRQQMSELLFETYNIPGVSYGIDSIMAMYHYHDSTASAPDPPQGLVLSMGPNACHILPVLPTMGNGIKKQQTTGLLAAAQPSTSHHRWWKRLDIGSDHCRAFMTQRLRTKRPMFQHYFTDQWVRSFFHKYCYCAKSLTDQLRDIKHAQSSLSGKLSDYKAKMSYSDVVFKEKQIADELPIMVQLPYRQPAVLSKAEQQRRAEKRRKQGLRLREIQRDKRYRLIAQKREELNKLLELKTILDMKRDKLRAKWTKKKSKKRKASPPPTVDGQQQQMELVDPEVLAWRRDKELEQDLKLLKKTEFESREDLEAALKVAQTQLDKLLAPPAKRKKNVAKVCSEKEVRQLLHRKAEVEQEIARMQRNRTERLKRHSAASKERMRLLAQLSEGRSGKSRSRKPKVRLRQKKRDTDTFGAHDSDWDVYKQIARDKQEKEFNAKKAELSELVEILDRKQNAEMRMKLEAASSRQKSKLWVVTERVMVPELLFQPSLAGHKHMGLAELLKSVLKHQTPQNLRALVSNVFLSGGMANLPGMAERIQAEVRMLVPYEVPVRVRRALDPLRDPWRGAAAVANRPDFVRKFCVTRKDYEECGHSYLKVHFASNENILSSLNELLQGSKV